MTRTIGGMSDLEVQKRLWGRDGHGIPGANPHYAGRAGIAVLVLALLFAVAFVTLTDHSAKVPDGSYYDGYVSVVVNGDVLQTGLAHELQASTKKQSSSVVGQLVVTLLGEDRLLLSEQWPLRVQGDIARFVRINRQQISVLQEYLSSSSSQRSTLLRKQGALARHALAYDAKIKLALKR